MFPSDRNQSVDLKRKSTDWFYMMGTLVFNGLIKSTLNVNETNNTTQKIFDGDYLRNKSNHDSDNDKKNPALDISTDS